MFVVNYYRRDGSVCCDTLSTLDLLAGSPSNMHRISDKSSIKLIILNRKTMCRVFSRHEYVC